MPKVDFIVGTDDFTDLQVIKHLTEQLHGFRQTSSGNIIDYFVLRESKSVNHVCKVTLILKTGDDRLTPRLAFSIRYRSTGEIVDDSAAEHDIKAAVDLSECHENYWKLVSYLKSLRELDIPDEHFSLTPNNTDQIKFALTQRHAETIAALTSVLTEDPTFSISVADALELNHRRTRLGQFQAALQGNVKESWWKDFFDNNKWNFGYGLDYRIGSLSEVSGDETKASTFQLFRESLHGVEIFTFDELLERAKFMVEQMRNSAVSPPQEAPMA